LLQNCNYSGILGEITAGAKLAGFSETLIPQNRYFEVKFAAVLTKGVYFV